MYPHSKSSVLNMLMDRLRALYEFSICYEFKTTTERDDVGKMVGKKCLPKISTTGFQSKCKYEIEKNCKKVLNFVVAATLSPQFYILTCLSKARYG
jgi:hypothetical protein